MCVANSKRDKVRIMVFAGSAVATFVSRFLLLLFLTFFLGKETYALTLHVAPNGKDSWTGRLSEPNAEKNDGPLASLEGARNTIRRLKLAIPAHEEIRVQVAEGYYNLAAPVEFLPEDSGNAYRPIIIEAAPGSHPVFSGGRRIAGFKLDKGGLWVAKLPEVARGHWNFEQLFVNGRRAIRARTPSQGAFFHVARRVSKDTGLGGTDGAGARTFYAAPTDIGVLTQLTPEQLTDVVVVHYHAFETSRLRISAVDSVTGRVLLQTKAHWPFGKWGKNQRYYIENFLPALDSPGEWFLDHRKGALYYRPYFGESIDSVEVYAPVLNNFVIFRGDRGKNQLVKNIILRGLAFSYAQYLLPSAGYSDPQAAVSIPATIVADGASNIGIENCEVSHVGTYAIWYRSGVSDSWVTGCRLHDLGAGGVRVGTHVQPQPDGSDLTRHIQVSNNLIDTAGEIFPGAVGIWIGHSPDNRIENNELVNLGYTGISIGWKWGYRSSAAKRNVVAYNRVHHIGRRQLSDMGGIYLLGPSEGTRVFQNVIHDVESYDKYGRGGWGIYADEGTSWVKIEKNIVYRTTTGGFHQHYGRENVVRNNIFALSAGAELQRSRVENHTSFVFERNIVLEQNVEVLAGKWKDDGVVLRNNVYFSLKDEPPRFAGMSFREWQALGKDRGSIVADPMFGAPLKGDFSMNGNSPAFKLGFERIDESLPGITNASRYLPLAKELRAAF